MRHDAAEGVDERADAAVGRSHQITPVLDRAKPREGEVEPRGGRVSEPGVVGEGHQKVRVRLAHHPPHQLLAEHFEADRCRDSPGTELERWHFGRRLELLQVREQRSELRSEALEWNVLGEGDEDVLVVGVADLAVGADQEHRVRLAAPSVFFPHGRGAKQNRHPDVLTNQRARDRQRTAKPPDVGRLGPDDEIERACREDFARLLEVARVADDALGTLLEKAEVRLDDSDLEGGGGEHGGLDAAGS